MPASHRAALPVPLSSPLPPRVWSSDDVHVVAQWCNVLITHWSDTPTVPPLEVCQKASFELASRFPPGIVVFNVITSNITLPSAEVRKKSSEVLATTGGHVRCTATIILGEGFWASAARAMLAGITLMSRQRHPHKVFGSIADAAAWCEPRLLPEGTRPADLVAVLARLGTQP